MNTSSSCGNMTQHKMLSCQKEVQWGGGGSTCGQVVHRRGKGGGGIFHQDRNKAWPKGRRVYTYRVRLSRARCSWGRAGGSWAALPRLRALLCLPRRWPWLRSGGCPAGRRPSPRAARTHYSACWTPAPGRPLPATRPLFRRLRFLLACSFLEYNETNECHAGAALSDGIPVSSIVSPLQKMTKKKRKKETNALVSLPPELLLMTNCPTTSIFTAQETLTPQIGLMCFEPVPLEKSVPQYCNVYFQCPGRTKRNSHCIVFLRIVMMLNNTRDCGNAAQRQWHRKNARPECQVEWKSSRYVIC